MSDMPPPPPAPTGGSDDRTIMLVLSYLGILALIPLLIKKDNAEIQWHAKNGLVFTVAFVVVAIVAAFAPLGCAGMFVNCGVSIAWLVVAILGIQKALAGQRFKIPGLSDFADKF